VLHTADVHLGSDGYGTAEQRAQHDARSRRVFRGIVDHSEDQISEQEHVVTFVAHDYLGVLARRPLIQALPYTYTNLEQDVLVATLLAYGGGDMSSLAAYSPGSNLPIAVALVGANGVSARTVSGTLRTRTYMGGTLIGTALDQLAKVIGGFDYDVIPEPQAGGGLGAEALNAEDAEVGADLHVVGLDLGHVDVATLHLRGNHRLRDLFGRLRRRHWGYDRARE